MKTKPITESQKNEIHVNRLSSSGRCHMFWSTGTCTGTKPRPAHGGYSPRQTHGSRHVSSSPALPTELALPDSRRGSGGELGGWFSVSEQGEGAMLIQHRALCCQQRLRELQPPLPAAGSSQHNVHPPGTCLQREHCRPQGEGWGSSS